MHYLKLIRLFLRTAALCFMVTAPAMAAPPDTLSYQGYLEDTNGPLNTTANIAFTLYYAPTQGNRKWIKTLSVPVSNGLFSVQLGGTPAFLPGTFDDALWLGMVVNGDPEMTQRKPLDGVGFSFKAGDADSVNGMQANEIIDAASDEVRTPISNLPVTLSNPGSYYATGNLDGSAGGIVITSDDVTLDLIGFTMDAGGNNGFGINIVNKGNITIRNGTVRGFGLAGIYQNSTAYNNGGGYGIWGNSASVLANNTARGNLYGIGGGSGSTLTGNTASNNTGAYAVYGGSGATLTENSAFNNAGWGIYGFASNTLANNTSRDNNTGQIGNRGGIRIGLRSQAIGNNSTSNYHTGIFVDGDSSVLRDNHATHSISVGGVAQCFYFASANNAAFGNTATVCSTAFAGTLPAAPQFIGNVNW